MSDFQLLALLALAALVVVVLGLLWLMHSLDSSVARRLAAGSRATPRAAMRGAEL